MKLVVGLVGNATGCGVCRCAIGLEVEAAPEGLESNDDEDNDDDNDDEDERRTTTATTNVSITILDRDEPALSYFRWPRTVKRLVFGHPENQQTSLPPWR